MTGIIVSTPPTVEVPPGSNAANPSSLPPVTYQYAILSLPQIWTAKQTFPLGNISLNASDILGGTIPASTLPNPTATTLGGVKSLASVGSKWINSIGTDGTPTQTQPAFTDISGSVAATQLPNPSASTLGGIQSLAAVGSRWINTISTSGVPSATQPAFTDISGNIATGQMNSGTNASASTFYRGDGSWAIVPGGGPPLGRLTLTSGTPVMATSVAAATTVYYTPYAGNTIPIYDGTNMVPTVFAELSQTTTDTTKSPAAVGASGNYDLFVWNDAGTLRCTRGPAWTNSTTRSLSLTPVNGVLLNASSITNGPAASRGTYVGTIRSNGTSTIDFIFGSGAVGGGASVLNVWNVYNRVTVGTVVTDTTGGAGYAYTSATIRQAKASAGNQISFVLGLQEDSVTCSYATKSVLAAASAAAIAVGFGFDSTTTFAGQYYYNYNPTTAIAAAPAGLAAVWANPAIGSHVLSANEQGDGVNANTFNQVALATLSATLRM